MLYRGKLRMGIMLKSADYLFYIFIMILTIYVLSIDWNNYIILYTFLYHIQQSIYIHIFTNLCIV